MGVGVGVIGKREGGRGAGVPAAVVAAVDASRVLIVELTHDSSRFTFSSACVLVDVGGGGLGSTGDGLATGSSGVFPFSWGSGSSGTVGARAGSTVSEGGGNWGLTGVSEMGGFTFPVADDMGGDGNG